MRPIENLESSLFYPQAKKWMWNYCIFLGSFIDSRGTELDLGVYIDPSTGKASAAIVFGNNPGEYYSGELDFFGLESHPASEKYQETRRRAKNLNLFK